MAEHRRRTINVTFNQKDLENIERYQVENEIPTMSETVRMLALASVAVDPIPAYVRERVNSSIRHHRMWLFRRTSEFLTDVNEQMLESAKAYSGEGNE